MTASAAVDGLIFHHLGLACRDLDREQAGLAPLGYAPEGDDFADVRLGIRGRFLVGGGPRIELVASLGAPETPPETRMVVEGWLGAGAKLYHTAYQTAAFDVVLAARLDGRAKLVQAPLPAVAFDGRRVAFLMTRTLMLVELIEAVP